MSTRKTKTAQRALAIVSQKQDVLSNDEKSIEETEENNESEGMLQAIYNKLDKLDGLERIEHKLDNLHDRVDLMEQRLCKLEDDNSDNQTAKNDVNTLKIATQELQKRLESIENRERQANIKLLNLPVTQGETKPVLYNKILEILKHINPQLTAENLLDAQRLTAARANSKLGQGLPDLPAGGQPSTSSQNSQRKEPPVIVKLSNINTAQDLLKNGNKRIKTYMNPQIRIVDDVSKITQEKRTSLLPKMRQLRAAGLFAIIPFSPVAKILYRQGNEWKTIFPEK